MLTQFIKRFYLSWPRLYLLSVLVFSLLGLGACSPPTSPLRVSQVAVSPEPKVGQVVTLTIEIMSTEDQPEVLFTVDFLEGSGNKIHHIAGDTEWRGPLAANQPKSFELTACVLQEGTWPIDISVGRTAPGDHYAALEIAHLKSSIDSGSLIRDKDWRGPGNKTPVSRPATVSPECSGKHQ